MFVMFGPTGRIFHGPLEEMKRIRAVERKPSVQAVEPVTDEEGGAPEVMGEHPNTVAVKAYEHAAHADLDRGPLYAAHQVMSRSVVVVRERDLVARAWKVLRDRRIHQAPVMDAEGRLVGIVSERDLLTAINIDEERVLDVLQRHVRDVMASPVVAALPETDLRQISLAMLEEGVDGVPVVNASETLIGFISRSDILRAVVADPPLSLWR